MHYEIAVSQQDLTEFTYNSEEPHTNMWISKLPTYEEAIGYEVRGHLLVVKFEDSEDGRIIYGNPSYTLQQVSQTIALACAMHKVKSFQLGASVHTIHVAVNHPSGSFIAKQEGLNQIVMHQAKGLVFVKEANFYMALEGSMVCQLVVDRMGLSMRNLIDAKYEVRFEDASGNYTYFPMSLVFTDPSVRAVYLRKESTEYDWAAKLNEIEQFVEEWTK